MLIQDWLVEWGKTTFIVQSFLMQSHFSEATEAAAKSGPACTVKLLDEMQPGALQGRLKSTPVKDSFVSKVLHPNTKVWKMRE